MERIAAVLDTALDRVARAARWLVLPLSLLLFLQWPLREVVQAGSRQANDAAQVLFALYVAVAISEATRRRSHLAVDIFTRGWSEAWRARVAKAGAMLILVPWAVLLLATGAMPAWRSLLSLESFPETINPGYFLVRAAGFLLAALVLVQAIRDVLAREPVPDE